MMVAITSAAAADQVSGTLISPNGPSLRDNHPPPGAPAPCKSKIGRIENLKLGERRFQDALGPLRVLKHFAAPERDAAERIIGDRDRQAGVVADLQVEPAQQSAA